MIKCAVQCAVHPSVVRPDVRAKAPDARHVLQGHMQRNLLSGYTHHVKNSIAGRIMPSRRLDVDPVVACMHAGMPRCFYPRNLERVLNTGGHLLVH